MIVVSFFFLKIPAKTNTKLVFFEKNISELIDPPHKINARGVDECGNVFFFQNEYFFFSFFINQKNNLVILYYDTTGVNFLQNRSE